MILWLLLLGAGVVLGLATRGPVVYSVVAALWGVQLIMVAATGGLNGHAESPTTLALLNLATLLGPWLIGAWVGTRLAALPAVSARVGPAAPLRRRGRALADRPAPSGSPGGSRAGARRWPGLITDR